MRIRQVHVPLRPLPQSLPDLLSKIREINHHLRNAVFSQQEEIPDYQRIGPQGQKWLRCGLRQRTKPGTETRCQDHGFHCPVFIAIRGSRE